MSSVLYDYPKQAEYNRILPKNKIYEKAKLTTALKNKFVTQIEKIEWKYVLAPHTINIKAGKTIKEIAIFQITLKQGEIDFDVFRVIDKHIRIPIFYLLIHSDNGKDDSRKRIKTIAAYKRNSDADSEKWVIEAYFESQWLKAETKREPLPVALDMDKLHAKLLRQLMPLPARAEETLHAQAERLMNIQNKQKELNKLEASLHREKQFNRKVEINSQLRSLKNELAKLTA